jgi:hypothetical protein
MENERRPLPLGSLRLLIAGVAFIASACSSRSAPRPVFTPPGCGSFEIVTVRSYRVASSIRGVVLFQDGSERQPLQDVEVVVRHLGSTEALATVTTDESGTFEFSHFADGWYQVEACRFGFTGYVVPVQVRRHARSRPIELSVSLAN